MALDVTWLTAFVDLPEALHPAGTAHWAGVTGGEVSSSRGAHGEFASLLPPDGDPSLALQRVGGPRTRVHLDVHVRPGLADAARAEALGLGAREDTGSPGSDTHVVLVSPAGIAHCLVPHRRADVPGPRPWPAGHTSLVDQVCLDVPADAWEQEVAYWSGLTGWDPRPGRHPDFVGLEWPAAMPLRLLVQRTGGDRAGLHLDVATTDRGSEVARHVALGAEVESVQAWWTVLRAPSGERYCVIDRPPR